MQGFLAHGIHICVVPERALYALVQDWTQGKSFQILKLYNMHRPSTSSGRDYLGHRSKRTVGKVVHVAAEILFQPLLMNLLSTVALMCLL